MRIFSEEGFSALTAIGVMVILAIFGFALAQHVILSHSGVGEKLLYDRSFYVTQGGLEYAMRRIYEGASPVVPEPGIAFGGGSFIISRVGRLITVTGRHGTAQVSHQVTSPSQTDCTDFDLSDADIDDNGRKLHHISFRKVCLEETVLDKIRLSWTNPGTEGVTKVRVESSNLYEGNPVASGQLTELSDFIVRTSGQNNFNEIRFNGNLEDRTFTMVFIMGDGSLESTSFTPD